EIVELGGTETLFGAPAHPYTEALLSAVPDIDDGTGTAEVSRRERVVLRDEVPNPVNKPTSCPFRTRCAHARELCAQERPSLTGTASGRLVACHYPLGG